ncbi:MAG: hydrogenase maturation protease [Coriobacteriales bacterium]|jgi:hydrogenase maturation protease
MRICVMGIGNILLMDEGVGPEVAKRLSEEYEFPENVEVMDCATMGYALLPEFRDFDLVVVIDAVDGTGQPAGTVFRFEPEDMARRTEPPSAHDVRIGDVIDSAKMLGYEARGTCVGIQVENMSPSDFFIGLTPDVEAAVPKAEETVLAILWNEGVRGIVDKRTGKMVTPDGR